MDMLRFFIPLLLPLMLVLSTVGFASPDRMSAEDLPIRHAMLQRLVADEDRFPPLNEGPSTTEAPVRIVGGLWSITKMDGPLGVAMWGEFPRGKSYLHIMALSMDPGGERRLFAEWYVAYGGSISMWHQNGNQELQWTIFETDPADGWNVSTEIDPVHLEDSVFLFLIASTRETRLGYRFEGLPAESVRLDRGSAAAGPDDLEATGTMVDVGNHIGTREGHLTVMTSDCAYGLVGAYTRTGLAAAGPATIRFDLPSAGVYNNSSPQHPTYVIWSAPPHEWGVTSRWTGLNRNHEPFVFLFEGGCVP